MSLPDRFHISWKNYLWESLAIHTLASTISPETAYPLTNMQNQNANEKTLIDMTGQTTVAITDTGSANTFKAANCFAIHNHDFPDGTTVRLRLYDAINQGGSVVYDSTATDIMHNIPFGSIIAGIDAIEGNFEDEGHMKTHFSLWFDDGADVVEYKSLKIDITNADGFTNDLLSIDKLWLGYAWAPTYGPENGFGSELIDDSEHFPKPGGGMETVDGDVRRSLALEFALIENSERHVIRHILDKAKKGGDLLVTMDPNDSMSQNYEHTSIYRRMDNISFIGQFYNLNSTGLALEEN